MPVGTVLFGTVFCLLDHLRYEIAGWVTRPAIFVDASIIWLLRVNVVRYSVLL